jgi:hypothetical protein
VDLALAWTSARKDLLRRARDPLAFLLWVGVPLTLAILIGFVSGGDGEARPRGRLLVADLDDSLASRAVSAAFAQGALAELFDVEAVELAAGRARIHDGDASALLVVPLGFGEALLLDQPTTLELVKNPARTILPRIAEETLGLAADAVFYAQRLAGDRLRKSLERIAEGPPAGQSVMSAAFVAGFAVEINNSIERLVRWLDPLALEVVDEPAPAAAEPAPNFALLFFPSMLFLSRRVLAQGLSEDLWREKALGTLRRASCAPGGLAPLLLGKLVSAVVLIALVGACGLGYAAARFDLPWSRLPAALAWLAVAGSLLFLGMALVQVHARTQRGGNLATSAVLFPLSMLGGSFFPFEVMPRWMAEIGRWTPNGWAMRELDVILAGESTLASFALGTAGATLAAAALFLVVSRRASRGFLRG